MERWVKRAIELAAGLVFTGKSNPSVIPYYPQKTEVFDVEEQYFRRTHPEKKGVSSGRLLAMLKALEKDKRANVHALVCVKGGEVICECSHPGYSVNEWHLSHSMSKTVTGMAIGMLVDDGKLSVDTLLIDIFPEIAYKDQHFAKITVKHLLTMRTGVKFSEAGSVTESKWTETFFSSACAFEPGTAFAYNSMNSYILARIVSRLSGMSLTDFLDERLFGPLGITNRFWEKNAEGTEKGGWGLYLSAESWAKIGYMMLSGGVFEGKRILSEKWVSDSHERHSATPDTIGHFDYGYQMWTSSRGTDYLFNGMLGQNVWICPDNDLVVVLLSGNNDLFQNSPARAIIEKYLGIDLSNDLSESCFSGDSLDLRRAEKHFFESRHWIRPYKQKHGIGHRLGLRQHSPYPEEWDDIMGKYRFAKNNVGMMPIVIRAMQNNFPSSLESIEIERDGDAVYLVYTESGISYRLEIGFSDFKETVLDLNGERYVVRVMGEAMEDEDRNMIYKLELLFPELPNTRMIKLSFTDDEKLLVRMSEMPNEQIAGIFLREFDATNPKMSAYMDLIEKRIGKNTANKRIIDTFAPQLIGARIGSEGYSRIMDEEEKKQKSGEKTTRFIDSVIDKLLREDDSDEQGAVGFIGEIVGRIKLKMPKKEKKNGALPSTDGGEDTLKLDSPKRK